MDNTSDLIFQTAGCRVKHSTMELQLGYPLVLSYLVLAYVTGGHARITVNFKRYNLSSRSLLVVSESDIVRFQDRSADFKIKYHMIDRDFASDIAFELPNHLFSFLHQNPVLKMNKSDNQQIEHWDLQHSYITKQAGIYQKKCFVNTTRTFFRDSGPYPG